MSSLLLIDGFNLLHSVVLKGRDRANWWKLERQLEVFDLCVRFTGPEETFLIFDAARETSERLPREAHATPDCHPHHIVYAPSADDWIVAKCQHATNQETRVVTADRALRDRAARHGALGLSPWSFAEQLNMSP